MQNIYIFTLYLLAGLTWDAGLKFTGVSLELLQDPDMYMFLERAIRGGISTVTRRQATANNPYIPDTYDPTKPHDFLMYLDANNLVSIESIFNNCSVVIVAVLVCCNDFTVQALILL